MTFELHSSMVLNTRVRAEKGSVLFRAPCSAPEISKARPQPSGGAIREVAPLHARPRGRSSRIGSFCDLVAAPFQAQALVSAVGWVRNASPICNFSSEHKRGFQVWSRTVKRRSSQRDLG